MNSLKYILIDGYNVVNAWRELKPLKNKSLEDARDKLIDMLMDYSAYVGTSLVVVFDAHLVKGSYEKHEKKGGIEIVLLRRTSQLIVI